MSKLKHCPNPKCESEDIDAPAAAVTWARCYDCGLTGPTDDPDGALWNALPRRSDIEEARAEELEAAQLEKTVDFFQNYNSALKHEIDMLRKKLKRAKAPPGEGTLSWAVWQMEQGREPEDRDGDVWKMHGGRMCYMDTETDEWRPGSLTDLLDGWTLPESTAEEELCSCIFHPADVANCAACSPSNGRDTTAGDCPSYPEGSDAAIMESLLRGEKRCNPDWGHGRFVRLDNDGCLRWHEGARASVPANRLTEIYTEPKSEPRMVGPEEAARVLAGKGWISLQQRTALATWAPVRVDGEWFNWVEQDMQVEPTLARLGPVWRVDKEPEK